MKLAISICLLFLLSGCSLLSRETLEDGRTVHAVSCGDGSVSCVKRANEICNGHFELVNTPPHQYVDMADPKLHIACR